MNSQQHLAGMNDKFWFLNQIAKVAQAKQLSRNAKGYAANFFVLDRKEKNDELAEFIKKLNTNLSSFKQNTRFQIIVGKDGHWTNFDFTVSHGKVTVFGMDAASDARGDAAAEYIAKHLKNVDLYFYTPDDEKFLDTRIQVDNFSCSRMSLEHTFVLSKMNVASALKKNKAKWVADEHGIKKITPQEIPIEMSKIFKVAQGNLKKHLLPETKAVKINKDDSLIDYIYKHTSENENQAIHHKKIKHIQKVEKMYETKSVNQIEEDLKNRQGYQFLEMTHEQRQDYLIAQTKNHHKEKRIRHKIIVFLDIRLNELLKPFFSRTSQQVQQLQKLIKTVLENPEMKVAAIYNEIKLINDIPLKNYVESILGTPVELISKK